jgi:hypothetical protein
MDPPDAIGLKYNSYKDNMSSKDYRVFIKDLIQEASDKCKVMWLSYNAKYTYMVGSILDNFLTTHDDWEAKPCVQTFTFYQHNHRDFGNAHRPLARVMRKGTPVFTDDIRVASWRQLNGDKRADKRGKVPGDVFDIPRVTGNSKQRRAWMPTQLNEDLYTRCIKSCCEPGDTVCDLFAGSGTLARVADQCDVNTILVDVDSDYCDRIAKEHKLEWFDD